MMRKVSWMLVGILCVVFVPLQAGTQETQWKKHMAAAAKAYQKGHYGDAEKDDAREKIVAFKNYVNDYVGIVSDKTEHDLNALLKDLERKTGAQIAVVVIDSTGGISAKDYAVQFGNRWGVGQKEKNNGVVFLVAVEDRKMFIATGTGLEKSILPNEKVADIRDRDILPHFRKGDIARGIVKGTLRLAQEISEAEGIRLKPWGTKGGRP